MGPLQGTHVTASGAITEIPVLVDADGNVLIRDPLAIPRYVAIPEVGGVPRTSQLWDAGSGQTIYHYHATYFTEGGYDAIVSGQRLLNAHPDCHPFIPGRTLPLTADTPITTVLLTAVGSAIAAAAGTTGGVIKLEATAATEAQTRAAMIKFDFALEDNVKTVLVHALNLFGSSRYGRTHIEGRKHA